MKLYAKLSTLISGSILAFLALAFLVLNAVSLGLGEFLAFSDPGLEAMMRSFKIVFFLVVLLFALYPFSLYVGKSKGRLGKMPLYVGAFFLVISSFLINYRLQASVGLSPFYLTIPIILLASVYASGALFEFLSC